MLAEARSLQHAPVLDPAIDDVASPGDLHLFHRGAGVFERAGGLPGLSTHVVVDGVEAEVVIHRELEAPDIRRRRNPDRGACGQRQKIAVVGTLGDAEEERSVRNPSARAGRNAADRRTRLAASGAGCAQTSVSVRRCRRRPQGYEPNHPRPSLGEGHTAGRDRRPRSAGTSRPASASYPRDCWCRPRAHSCKSRHRRTRASWSCPPGCCQRRAGARRWARRTPAPVLVDLGAERGPASPWSASNP